MAVLPPERRQQFLESLRLLAAEAADLRYDIAACI